MTLLNIEQVQKQATNYIFTYEQTLQYKIDLLLHQVNHMTTTGFNANKLNQYMKEVEEELNGDAKD